MKDTVKPAARRANRTLQRRVEEFTRALQGRIGGEVRFDDGSRALYATDGSNYRQVPLGVVIPRTVDDIVATVAAARAAELPLLGRGCGTSLAGQCCNAAVVIDTSKYLNKVLQIDAGRRLAHVEPGAILDDVRRAAARHGLTFGPDPATHSHCTIGGMVGNNSCGVHALQAEFYGPGPRTADNVEALEVLTCEGMRLRLGADEPGAQPSPQAGRDAVARGALLHRLARLGTDHADLIRKSFPHIPRRVSGYNLPKLLPGEGRNFAQALVGTESTCALTLQATLKLIAAPRARVLLVLGYADIYEAGDHVMEIRAHRPMGLEGIDELLIDYMKKKGMHPEDVRLLPEGKGWLLVEFGGDSTDEAAGRADGLMQQLKRATRPPAMTLYKDPARAQKIWEVRESGLGATAFVPGQKDTWPGWEDSAVPPERVGDYLRDLRKLLQQYGYGCALYGHLGQGCIHTRIDFDLRSKAGIARFRGFTRAAAELVVHRYGGSLSGEHGDGQARADLLEVMYPQPVMKLFREFKSIWDPHGRMNPGKVIDAAPRDAHLRLGPGYPPATAAAGVRTHFHFAGGGFTHAALRCVGVGKCRRLEGGTMCPSFMATREERHSTRGRARLLFEMLQGDPLEDGWNSRAVHDALHLCLACKGCKGDCPVNVDMATYKAEFLSHYYEHNPRPRSALAFGLIWRWSRFASHLPRTVNFLTQTPPLAQLAKAVAGMAPRRQIPRYATRSFQRRVRGLHGRGGARKVLLWPDTFNNYFHPDTADAAREVLGAAGFDVQVPAGRLCCGRPLYDYGMLDQAKALLRGVLERLRPQIADGTPIVVLEPSCAAVFRDELPDLLPQDPAAARLARQTFLLAEFLRQQAPDFSPPPLGGQVLLHGHCHQKALMSLDPDRELLERLGVAVTIPESGCCGMAGSFGFERDDRYEVSLRIGERALLPAVRAAGAQTVIVSDGFSCREQIRQCTPRRALHLAEVLQRALHGGHTEQRR
ncbi:MAG TPA: FAD-binding and (Fe-S)-binding domain-containing protein [Steroidobacteraceae bacterium]|nr:FAD-binding and (Fe-S)-binding domain-containing protein [Steroidobacteraceae bacterium]